VNEILPFKLFYVIAKTGRIDHIRPVRLSW